MGLVTVARATSSTTGADGRATSSTTGADGSATSSTTGADGSATSSTTGADGRATSSTTALVVLLAIAVLLTGCEQGDSATGCDVDVDTAELRGLKADAGMADCPTGAGEADLPDIELACLGGGSSGALAAIEGPAIINFWASNCSPCVKEMPALEEFHQQYGDQVPVIGVDFLDTYPGAALDLAERTGATYPSYADPCGDLQESDLVVSGLPTFVFVHEDGSTAVTAGGVDSLGEVVELAEDKLDIELERRAA